jgi:hypothetical protein
MDEYPVLTRYLRGCESVCRCLAVTAPFALTAGLDLYVYWRPSFLEAYMPCQPRLNAGDVPNVGGCLFLNGIVIWFYLIIAALIIATVGVLPVVASVMYGWGRRACAWIRDLCKQVSNDMSTIYCDELPRLWTSRGSSRRAAETERLLPAAASLSQSEIEITARHAVGS